LIIFYILVTIPSKGKGLKPEPKQIKHQMAVRNKRQTSSQNNKKEEGIFTDV
jgi:hypothetical protein